MGLHAWLKVPQFTGVQPGTALVRCALYGFTEWTVRVTVRDPEDLRGCHQCTRGFSSMTESTISTSTTNEPEPSDTMKAFGAAHKAFRKRAGYTQEEYAPLVGYQPATVASIEQGRRFPPRAFVERAEE